ncbi:MAG: hypothetical protein ACJAZP_003865 [Psychromonas sp.]|jgi:hypothetical protein
MKLKKIKFGVSKSLHLKLISNVSFSLGYVEWGIIHIVRERSDLHVAGVGVELKAYNSDLFYRIGKDSSYYMLFVAMGGSPKANNSKGIRYQKKLHKQNE